MGPWAAITVLGRDRPGIVAGITRVLYEHGCNLEDSSATRLRDAFAMILVARLPTPPRFEELATALELAAGRLGVSLDLRDLGELPPEPAPEGERYLLSVYGADRPGIVYRFAAALAEESCNVTDVATRIAGTGEAPIYVMLLEMTIPSRADVDAIAGTLDELKRELSVDIAFRAVEEETL